MADGFGDPRDARTAPANIEAEQCVLGLVLYDNRALSFADGLEPHHFLDPLHGRLWAAIVERIGKDSLIDPNLLASVFADDGAFNEIGGVVFLAQMVDQAPTAPPARVMPGYVGEIIDLAMRRDLIAAAGEITAAARDRATPAADVLAEAERTLAEVAHGGPISSAWVDAGDMVAAALEKARTSHGLPGITTGLQDMDEATGGLRRGQLAILAARPSMGKTSAALNIARAVAGQGRGVAFFSMEMAEFDLGLRVACDVAFDRYAPWFSGRSTNPAYFDAARNRLDRDQWRALDEARDRMHGWPLKIDPRPGLTVPQMLAATRRLIRTWERAGVEPGLIILDHLSIARPDQDRRGNKVAEIGDISRGLAEMAKTLDLPVLSACQLSRDVDKRPDKDRRPNLSDLRWSGEIEQDARLVMFLYRPEYYVRRPEDRQDFAAEADWKEKLNKVKNKLFWLIEKNNNGPTAEIETYCSMMHSAVRDRGVTEE